MAFAERITAHKTLLNSGDLSGVFLFLLVVVMDTVEIIKNIEMYSSELNKYQSLSRQLLTRDEMILVDKKIVQFRERIKNLRVVLDARQ